MAAIFDNPVIDRPHPVGSGVQKIYRFKNGYGASVVRFTMASNYDPMANVVVGMAKTFADYDGNREYGSYTDNEDEYELAVIRFTGKENIGWDLVYDTPITDDVIGHLTQKEVEAILKKIKALKG